MRTLSDERLSSLLDDELDGIQRQQAIEILSQDDEARERWERFNLASDALHGNLPGGIDTGFSSRVMAAIADEPAILAPPPSTDTHDTSPQTATVHPMPSRFGRRLAGLAVAASVAAVAVMGVETLHREDPAAPAPAAVAQAGNAQPGFGPVARQRPPLPATLASVNAGPQATPSRLATTRAEVLRAHPEIARRIDPRLRKYLINHSQQAARSNVQGAMPYARIVTYPGFQQPSVRQ